MMFAIVLFLAIADPAPIDWTSVCREANHIVAQVGEREAIRIARERGFTWAQIARAKWECRKKR